ncbi:PREDICTED: putative F-box protein At3g20705 [Tarenaya hassleriana]|uniref:putative F-box protein At3g20705 n=1 Tax=Tarenaya hassleriana TaxID=28532 RepID=UPI00053C9EB3|nr:PREDICTED: putative F-box protein At3g20705 [Tarenaya hassleriana]
MNEVPSELVEEILARVPAKDLLRFRCVCKRWKSLIEDKQFIKKHLACSRQKFISHGDYHLATSYSRLGNRTKILLEKRVKSVLYSNGLICLRFTDKSLAIWNPALRELRDILPTTAERKGLENIGFGYDHSTDDHKIVLFTSSSVGRAEIISLRSGSRAIDSPPYDFQDRGDSEVGVSLGDHMFWLVWHRTECDNLIMSFDVVSETFKCFSCPSADGRVVYGPLMAIGRYICVANKPAHTRANEISVWGGQFDKGESRVESWSNLFTVTIDDLKLSRRSWFFEQYIVECDAKAMEVLVKVYDRDEWKPKVVRLSAFDVRENVFTKFDMDYRVECGPFPYPYPYKESLVSPYGFL